MQRSGTLSSRLRGSLISAVMLTVISTSCTSAPPEVVTPADYRTAVEAVCTDTSNTRDELAEPTESGAVAEFARNVAALLAAEAETIRNIRPPAELDGDHRAFVQNTADQAQRWTALATTSPADTVAFASLTDEIAALSFGRDDLAAEMALDACQRTS